jgi:hypothetical protein
MTAIESYLPEVGSPLFHSSVEEFASLWEANPSVSYETVLFRFLVSHFLLAASAEWYDDCDTAPVSITDITEIKESFFVANAVSEQVSSFCVGKFPHQRVDKCVLGNRCSDASCQLFHGPLCEFHAGMKVHFGGPKRGQKMTCGKGVACPFDHASAELRAARVSAGIQQKRLQFAPSLSTEADILAVFPSISWRFADVYTYERMTPQEMDLLEICLERSPALEVVALEGGLQIRTTDFMDSREMPEPEIHIPIASVPEGFTEVRRRR